MKVLFFIQDLQFIERLGIMYLSATLNKNGYQTKLIKTQGLSFKQIKKEVKRFSPDIFAFSVMTGEHNYYLDLNKKLKKHFNAFSIFGGPHPTFFPEMIKKDGVDAICIGEGEGAILDLVKVLKNKKNPEKIKNLWIKKGKKIIKNSIRPLVENLDRLPFPDRELIYKAAPEIKDYKTKLFFSGRGCPFQCTYCFNHQYNLLYKNRGKIVRFRSVDNFIAEILDVKRKYPFKFAMIEDDTFLLKPPEWLKEFAEKMRKTKIRFWCNVRADLITKETVKLLKKAGCHAVWFGIECGNEKIRCQVLKRFMTNERVLNACYLFKKYKIVYSSQNLIALPVENPLKVDLETLDLNIKCKPDFAWSSILYPYPRTVIGEYARKKGHFRKKSWDEIQITNKMASELTFNNPNEKKKLERLHKIFGVVVEFSFLRPFVNVLISLPFDKLYQFIFFSWYGYCMRVRMESWKKNPRDFWQLFKSLISYLETINKKSAS